ncbi:hypothetical protein BJX64DRAFT_287976 [Aspergillus heterothallicus]
MPSVFATPELLATPYGANGLWFISAFVHFGFRQKFMMGKRSLRKSSTDPARHHDIMLYLGGSTPRLPYSPSCGSGRLRAGRFRAGKDMGSLQLDIIALAVLGLANFWQAFLNFTTGRNNGRWTMGKGFDRITVLDALCTVLDRGAAIAKIGLI